jgi:adenylosuccinate synthase
MRTLTRQRSYNDILRAAPIPQKQVGDMPMFNTSFVFSPGKLTITLDGGAGSSGKGKLGSFLCEHADNWQFACHTFMPQAAHWVKLDDGREILFKSLNSCAYRPDRYQKLYTAPGAAIDLAAFFEEIAKCGIPPKKIGISPLTAVLQEIDGDYEIGKCDLDGNAIAAPIGGYLAKTGTTAKGSGANRARRVLRHKKAKYARDVPDLKKYLCDVPREIMGRLDQGQAGLFEIAQGFQLSYLLPEFYPFTTSRNCTVAAGLDDLMVPPCYTGNVVLNFRTFPIRINSNKYVDKKTCAHLTMDEVAKRTGAPFGTLSKEKLAEADIVLVDDGSSGHGYPDQEETSWEKVAHDCGRLSPIDETTSATRLPRRCFTFSKENVRHAIRHNRAGAEIFLSLNFADYVDDAIAGQRGQRRRRDVGSAKLDAWLNDNLGDQLESLKFIGTGPKTNDMIQLI